VALANDDRLMHSRTGLLSCMGNYSWRGIISGLYRVNLLSQRWFYRTGLGTYWWAVASLGGRLQGTSGHTGVPSLIIWCLNKV
jgi:hypothetical protein